MGDNENKKAITHSAILDALSAAILIIAVFLYKSDTSTYG